MLSLQAFTNISATKAIRFKSYSAKLSDKAFRHLLWGFNDHLERTLGGSSTMDQTTSLAVEVFHHAWKEPLYEKRETEVKKVIQKSIPITLDKITTREIGSKKGVMYEEEFYQVILNAKDGYMMHDQIARSGTVSREYPCFFSGRDVCHLIKKDGVLASDAIHSFLEGPTSADCGSAVEAVFYKAILDLLGEEKFNKLFEQRKLEIDRYASCFGKSAIAPFLEYKNPNVYRRTNEKTLEVGDHFMLVGVPWYSLKHPNGNMGNSHGIVVDFDRDKKPLVQGLGVTHGLSYTLDEIKQSQVAFANAPRSNEDLEYIEKYYDSVYPTPEVIKEHRKKRPYFKPLNNVDVFKETTVKEANAYGGCLIRNDDVTRLSTSVLAKLKEAPLNADLNKCLMLAKAEVIARQMFASYEDYCGLFKKVRE